MKKPQERVQEFRKKFKEGDDIRDKGLATPQDIQRFDDLAYGSAPMQVLDIYCPKGTDHPLPTIVSIHGGGYVYGDKERYQYYCMDLAQRGFTVVNFSYPLAPEHRYPAHLFNTNEAVRYAVEHASLYHIDTNNMFFVGDSAGAQINSQYAAAVVNPDYARLLGLDIPPLRLRAIALNCGMYDRTGTSDDIASHWYLGPLETRSPELIRQMDVLSFIDHRYPPTFVMSAVKDFLLENAGPMHELLRGKGVESELHIYGTPGENDLGHVFHCNIRLPDAVLCNDEECRFFLRHAAIRENRSPL